MVVSGAQQRPVGLGKKMGKKYCGFVSLLGEKKSQKRGYPGLMC